MFVCLPFLLLYSTTTSDAYNAHHSNEHTTEIIASTVAANANPGAGAGMFGAAPAANNAGAFNFGAAAPEPTAGALGAGAAPENRPVTAIRGAGYTSGNKKKTTVFDPMGQASQGVAPPLVQRSEGSPEFQAKDMEKDVNTLIEESSAANLKKDFRVALEKAKEAGKKERILSRFREKNGLTDQLNFDLTYAVCFNLANQYHANGMYMEALNTYSVVVKNKQYAAGGRLRVNMGNIYYQQKKYPSAIKMYRMAMDQIGSTSREMRFRIMRNIGNSFVRLGQFQDAIQSYEAIMDGQVDPQTAFNLILCYYALGDPDKMKKGFIQLINVQTDIFEGDDEDDVLDKKDDPFKVDDLAKTRGKRKKQLHKYVLTAAKLIAPVVEKTFSDGFDWVIEYLKTPRRTASPAPTGHGLGHTSLFETIAMEMEIAKGIAFLKKKDIKKATEVFRSFENKDNGLIAQAATNLSFLTFLKGDMKGAERYAEIAVKESRYNAKALVNKANVLFMKELFEDAREMYLEAIGVEADCVEAIFNLGLTNKRLEAYEDALQAFKKLHRIVPKDPQVIYQIANLYDLMGSTHSAAEWFKILHGSIPTDPKILARLGTLYAKEEDETQAFHNFSDSYHNYPVNMEVISWLGVWYVKSELYEDAIQFFERAAEIEPHEIKWQLMVASCYRRIGSSYVALELYKKIHKQDPDNIECLRYLCNLCSEVNDDKYRDYHKLLRKAERAQEREQHMQEEVKDHDEGGYGDQHDMNGMEQDDDDDHQTYGGQGAQYQNQNRDADDSFVNSVQVDENVSNQANINQNRNTAPDDDWFEDGDLGDDLLPM